MRSPLNLLLDPLLSVSANGRTTLSGLFAAMACDRVRGFPALRPHQRPAWHMFLVQLGALALYWGSRVEIPEDEATWTSLLRGLTPDHADDAPWRLEVYDWRKPAFLQPPVPGRLKWSPVATPDELDLLITARNHDLKSGVARDFTSEDWIYALVSLQTCEGYGGKGNYGIARMNGGSSSRPMLGLAPARTRGMSLDPSAWWLRDVRQLLRSRRSASEGGPPRTSLLWCADWPEDHQLVVDDLDPWFIEVCRRVRLDWSAGRLRALRAASRKSRITSWSLQGNTGDPWAPVHDVDGRSLTLGSGEFDYRRLCDLVFSGNWELPLLCLPAAGETGDQILVAEALSRGNVKTDGFQSRLLPIPEDMLRMLAPNTPVAALAMTQVEEAEAFARALEIALAVLAAGGGEADKRHFRHALASRRRFHREVDRLFFESLWRRARAEEESEDARLDTQCAFLSDLLRIGETELHSALPGIRCPAVLRPKAEARARRRFRTLLWSAFPRFFEHGSADSIENTDGEHGEASAIARASRSAARMLYGLAPEQLARTRRMTIESIAPAYWELASQFPDTIGYRNTRAEWIAVIRILADLTAPGDPGRRFPLNASKRPLGEALCDGGNPYSWPGRTNPSPIPVFSERKLAQLLAARGALRSVLLERAVRMLAAARAPGRDVDPADIAQALLAPEDDSVLAHSYYQRLDRASWDTSKPRNSAK